MKFIPTSALLTILAFSFVWVIRSPTESDMGHIPKYGFGDILTINERSERLHQQVEMRKQFYPRLDSIVKDLWEQNTTMEDAVRRFDEISERYHPNYIEHQRGSWNIPDNISREEIFAICLLLKLQRGFRNHPKSCMKRYTYQVLLSESKYWYLSDRLVKMHHQ